MKYVSTLFGLIVLAASTALSQSATAPVRSAAKKNASSTSTKVTAPRTSHPASKTGSKKTTAATKKTATSRTGSGRKGKTVTRVSAPARQMAPTPERYKEIQQALADKGYLKSEPTGVWDGDSTEALKQFQSDKNLTPTGKITAASLIGLGLGPKNVESSSGLASPQAESAVPSAN